MSVAPFGIISNGDSELSNLKVDIVEGGGSSSDQRTKKMSALRNFFKRSPTNNDGITPRSEGASGRAAGSAHHATTSGEEDFEDHMLGSTYSGTDICKACGFPRANSVCCPVTHHHHGSDELMTPGKHHRSHSSSGGMGIVAKLRSKLSHTSGRSSKKHSGDDGERDHTPLTQELQRPPPAAHSGPDAVEEGEVDGAKETPFICSHMSPLSLHLGSKDDEHSAKATANLDAYASGDSSVKEPHEEEVQYYCYTDEAGDTYYYTQELLESGNDGTQHPPCVEGEGEAADGTGAAAAADLPDGAYIYQYVDEDGVTVNCLCTPKASGDSHAGNQQEGGDEGTLDTTTPATSMGAHPGSDTANSSEADESSVNRRKSPSALLSAIQSVFRPRSGARTHGQQHEDPHSTGESSSPAQTPPSGAAAGGSTNGDAAATHEYDADVTAFMELLNSSEKKKFMKERKNLIKGLEANEKCERKAITKNRQGGMAAFTREKLSVASAIRKDERTIRTGQKRGEPL